jgi:branched-chain amino acid transport system permease protein
MEITIQLIINSIISGLLLLLVAYGFSLIFNVTRVFHIAHGAVYVASVYVFIFSKSLLNADLPVYMLWIIPIFITIIFVILLAGLIELLVYRPLYTRRANDLISLITSLGLYVVIVNVIAVFFGNETIMINNETGKTLIKNGIIITHGQQVQFIVSLLCIFILSFPFMFSDLSKKIRAVTDNQEIASVIGIDVKKIRLIAIIFGSLLAASSGLLNAYDIGIEPQMGMNITLSAVVVVILAGQNKLRSLLFTSMFISVVQNFTEWFLSAQWKEGITYLILIIVLLFRTEGILSYKLRVEEK